MKRLTVRFAADAASEAGDVPPPPPPANHSDSDSDHASKATSRTIDRGEQVQRGSSTRDGNSKPVKSVPTTTQDPHTSVVFPVPPPPVLSDVVGRLRATRRGPPGYDMKTLRRQLESMKGDLQQRMAARSELFDQNIELYAYITRMTELRSKYQRQISVQTNRVVEELQSMDAERSRLKQELMQLSDIQQESDEVKAESARLDGITQDGVAYKKSLESELMTKNTENDTLAAQLQTQAAEVMKFHNEIEGLRINLKIASIEDRLESRHSEFDRKSAKRHAIRVLFAHAKQVRHLRAFSTRLHNIYNRHLLEITFGLWNQWLRIRRDGMHLQRVTEQRNLFKCMQLWKNCAMFERLSKMKRLGRLKDLAARILIHWKIYTAESKATTTQLRIANSVNTNRLLYTVFKAWVGVTLFLNTNFDMKSYDKIIRLHRKRIIFRRMKKAAVLSQSDLLVSLNEMKSSLRKKYFGRWIVSYNIHKFEEKASKQRVISLLRNLSSQTRKLKQDLKSSIYFRYTYRVRKALIKWHKIVSLQIQGRRVINALQGASLIKSKQLTARFSRAHGRARYALMCWATRTESAKRMYLLITLALRFRKKRHLRNAIARLRLMSITSTRSMQHKVKNQNETKSLVSALPHCNPIVHFADQKLLRFALHYFKDYACIKTKLNRRDASSAPSMKPSHIAECSKVANHYYVNRMFTKTCKDMLKYWLQRTVKNRVETCCYKSIMAKLRRKTISTAFTTIRTLYSKRLCWRMKASLIDQSELFSQLNLLHTDASTMELEISDIDTQISELEDNTGIMNASVAKRDEAIAERQAFLDALRVKRANLEETLKTVNDEVGEARQRRQRMTYLEDVLKREAEMAEEEAKASTIAADKLLRKLERDAARMKSKVKKTRATVGNRKANIAKLSNAKAVAVSKEIAKAEVAYSKIAKGIAEIEMLEDVSSDSAFNLSELRDRIQYVEAEGQRALEEENERLGIALVDIRALRLDTTQLEAKVDALEADYQRRFQALPIDIQRRLMSSLHDTYNHSESPAVEPNRYLNSDAGTSDSNVLSSVSHNRRYVDYDSDGSNHEEEERKVSSIGTSESPDSVSTTSGDAWISRPVSIRNIGRSVKAGANSTSSTKQVKKTSRPSPLSLTKKTSPATTTTAATTTRPVVTDSTSRSPNVDYIGTSNATTRRNLTRISSRQSNVTK